tara:strand:- start:5106 stop:5360 length:255 start_codon:yes stop_codon:yes gene_type:complete
LLKSNEEKMQDNNTFVRSPSNPFIVNEIVSFKFNDIQYENVKYMGQLSPYDLDDNNPLLLFETENDFKLRVKLKAITIKHFGVV